MSGSFIPYKIGEEVIGRPPSRIRRIPTMHLLGGFPMQFHIRLEFVLGLTNFVQEQDRRN